MELWKLLLVMIGGGGGAGLRYLVGLLGTWLGQESFPWTTFVINLTGSLALGFLVSWAKGQPDRALWLLLLGTGVCGGFTTYSTFSVETLALLEQDRFATAFIYVVGSVLAALIGAWLGSRL
jgi:fluoride exporter